MDLINGTILIVDDDRDVLETAIMFLKQKFSKVTGIEDPAKIEGLINKTDYDTILLDMNFKKGDMEGA